MNNLFDADTCLALYVIMGFSYIDLGLMKNEKLKGNTSSLSEETIKKIHDTGILHFTSKENAEEILKLGYIKPSKGKINNHFAKARFGKKFADFVYAYAGKPSFSEYLLNFSGKSSNDGTLYAVKYIPDQYELENFRERAADGAIMYEGQLNLANARLVRYQIKDKELEEIGLEEKVENKGINKIISNSRHLKKIISDAYTLKNIFKIANNSLNSSSNLRLTRCVKERKRENAMIAQINEQYKEMTIIQGEKKYLINPMGAKIDGGKVLNGFIIKTEDESYEKCVFIDLIDRASINDEDLCNFLIQNSNMESERSEYIGRPIFIDGKLQSQIDDGYKAYFIKKQFMQERNGEIPNNKNAESISNQLKKLAENYRKSTIKGRNKIVDFFKGIRSKINERKKCNDRGRENI